jgi:alkylation response protein AidB-like acyl-CoA dehydrogenase
LCNAVNKDAVRLFCQQSIRTGALSWDLAEQFPADTLVELGEQGFFGVLVPQHYGGQGWGYAPYCFLIEELATADPSLALLVAAHNSLCTNHILLCGTEAQKAKYLPRLASGEWLGSWALTEAGAGSDAAAVQTRAERTDSGWVLNGEKRFTTNASGSHVNVVLANIDGTRKGITAFIVDCDNPGRNLGERIHTMGMRASQTYTLGFKNCQLGDDALLGRERHGLADALTVLNGGRLSIAALSLGIARGAYEDALAYAKTREQFGKRLVDLPAVRSLLVDMSIAIATGRALLEKAVAQCERGEDFATAAAMAKLVTSEAAVRVADLSLQVHGGNGYVAGTRPEKFYRDAKLCTIGEGTSEILRLILGRSLDGV